MFLEHCIDALRLDQRPKFLQGSFARLASKIILLTKWKGETMHMFAHHDNGGVCLVEVN